MLIIITVPWDTGRINVKSYMPAGCQLQMRMGVCKSSDSRSNTMWHNVDLWGLRVSPAEGSVVCIPSEVKSKCLWHRLYSIVLFIFKV